MSGGGGPWVKSSGRVPGSVWWATSVAVGVAPAGNGSRLLGVFGVSLGVGRLLGSATEALVWGWPVARGGDKGI